MGLEIPERIVEEREMWWSLTSFVYDNDPNAMESLSKYRKRQSVPTLAAVAGPEKRDTASEEQQDEQPDESMSEH